MRWFFLILLVLNIALFAWFQQEQDMRNRLAGRTEFSGVEVDSLRLLSEVKLKLPLRKAPQAAVEQSKQAASSLSGCFVIGDFDSVSAARQFQQSQMPVGTLAEVRPVQRTAPDYQVYIRAPENVRERQQLLERLQSSGLEVSEIRQGPLKGQLSLGHYQNRSLAMALYDALKAQSYGIEISEQTQPQPWYVIELKIKDSQSEVAVWMADFMESGGGLKSEKKVCEGVASARDPE